MCGAVWRPVIGELDSSFRTLAWDFPNHGSAPRLPMPVDWWAFGDWARRQVEACEKPIIGVGHSMGGASLVMAELLAPSSFAGLLLFEPMLFPPPYRRAENHLSQVVRKRRPRFESRRAARENFGGKEPFMSWHPDALAGYLDCGLVATETDEMLLACTPEAEADVYEGAFAHGAWERLGEIETPSLIMAGSASDSFPAEKAEQVAALFPRAGFEVVEGANHFLPMEDPGLLARRIERLAAGVVSA